MSHIERKIHITYTKLNVQKGCQAVYSPVQVTQQELDEKRIVDAQIHRMGLCDN